MADKRSIIFTAILISVIALIAYELWPLIDIIANQSADPDQLTAYIQDYGSTAVPLIITLHVTTQFLFFTPGIGVIICVLSGVVFGPLWGTIISLIGKVIGQYLLMFIFRHILDIPQLRIRIDKLLNERRIKLQDLINAKYVDILIAVMTFAPIIPVGLLPVVFHRSHISTLRYALASTSGMLISTIIYNVWGTQISRGSWTTAVITLTIYLLIYGTIFIFRDKLYNKLTK